MTDEATRTLKPGWTDRTVAGSRDYRGNVAEFGPYCPSPVRRSSPRSPIWTRAISPPISRRAPDTAICSCGVVLQCHRHAVQACPPSSHCHGKSLAEQCRDHFPRPVVTRCGAERNRRHGDRSRRVSRSFHRPEPVCLACRCSGVWRLLASPYTPCWCCKARVRPIEV